VQVTELKFLIHLT